MAIGSVVQTVRSNLKTQLEARSGLSGVSVFKYAPLDQAPKKEMIYLGDANSGLSFNHLDQFMKNRSILNVCLCLMLELVTLLLEQLKQEQLHLQMKF